jgi:uncharacterized protein (DUF2147 family)
MKKIIALCVGLLLVSGLCFAADPAEGFWVSIDEKTEKPTAGWQIYAEKGVLYGKIISVVGYEPDVKATSCKESYKGYPFSNKVNEQKVIGSVWIWGLTSKKEGEWSGGNVISPDDGKMYQCKITFRKAEGKKFKDDVLEMRGEIGLGIGRSQYWKKATQQEASSLK